MSPDATIDHHSLARLAGSDGVQGTRIVCQTGGWGVVVRQGDHERALTATRSRQVRLFRRLETLVVYLKGLGIHRFEVDAAGFDTAVKVRARPDTALKLKRAHAALAHDQWFRQQVAQAIEQANDPATPWLSDDEVKADSARRRAAWRSRGKSA